MLDHLSLTRKLICTYKRLHDLKKNTEGERKKAMKSIGLFHFSQLKMAHTIITNNHDINDDFRLLLKYIMLHIFFSAYTPLSFLYLYSIETQSCLRISVIHLVHHNQHCFIISAINYKLGELCILKYDRVNWRSE